MRQRIAFPLNCNEFSVCENAKNEAEKYSPRSFRAQKYFHEENSWNKEEKDLQKKNRKE